MVRLSRILLCVTLAIMPLAALAAEMAMSNTATPADKAFMASMTTMNHAMAAAQPTGDTDRDFVAMMLPHHQGAVAMAKVELHYGKDPLLRAMAAEIVASQDKEIDTMKGWQAKHVP